MQLGKKYFIPQSAIEVFINKLSFYYINTNEIAGELSRVNIISSQVK